MILIVMKIVVIIIIMTMKDIITAQIIVQYNAAAILFTFQGHGIQLRIKIVHVGIDPVYTAAEQIRIYNTDILTGVKMQNISDAGSRIRMSDRDIGNHDLFTLFVIQYGSIPRICKQFGLCGMVLLVTTFPVPESPYQGPVGPPVASGAFR